MRDETTDGASRDAALVTTMTRLAARCCSRPRVVALSMAKTDLFAMHFLKSFAYAGVAAVADPAARPVRSRRRSRRCNPRPAQPIASNQWCQLRSPDP
ncbi:hypothetical protein EAH80_15130 [Mycobacterium hodleri]|uniref:Uncharacterized protein n=1 Tax=Mycolicibacterium hodleri TaxID=49897 RepID=A0A502EAR4_9MYCO|nr:hypothetical protein EAH80_15130 [Mycolicibacterium hodleri]